MTAIAEGHVEPGEREGHWTVKQQGWWNTHNPTLHPGPLGWGQQLWQTLRTFAASQVAKLKLQLDSFQSRHVRHEKAMAESRASLGAALKGESVAREGKAGWQAYASKLEKERDELPKTHEPEQPEPESYSSPSPF